MMKAHGVIAIGLSVGIAAICLGRMTRPDPALAQDGRTWTGVSLPSRKAAIGPEQDGVIVEMPKAEGERVVEGDVLCRLSSEIQALEVERLEALADSGIAVDKAQKSLEYAERVEERLHELADKEITSDAELQERQFALAMARAEHGLAVLEQTLQKNKLEQARARLAQRTVRSPFSGLVTVWHRQPGEPADRLEPVIEVARLDPLWITFDCPMRDQRLFALGDEVLVASALEPAKKRIAEVVFLSMQATPSSHTFRIRLSTPNPDHDWKAGMKMQVSPGPPRAAPPGGKGK